MKKSATVNLLAVRKCRWRSSRIPSMLSAQASVDTRATYLKYKIVIKWHSFLEYMYNCAHIIKNNGISTLTSYKMQCRSGALFSKKFWRLLTLWLNINITIDPKNGKMAFSNFCRKCKISRETKAAQTFLGIISILCQQRDWELGG